MLILLETPLEYLLTDRKNLVYKSQSLFYWKLLCNQFMHFMDPELDYVTILILLETPLQ